MTHRSDTVPTRTPASLLSDRCRQRLDALRKECPDIPALADAGAIVGPVELTEAELAAELKAVFAIEPGLTVVWSDAGSEALVDFATLRVAALPHGVLLVGLPIETDQTGRRELTILLALGWHQRMAGMNAVTERKPRGPEVLIARWGSAAIAATWTALMDVASARAARAGRDTLGWPLVPAALLVEPPKLQIVPRALFPFERPALA
jgi:hypothetical protein